MRGNLKQHNVEDKGGGGAAQICGQLLEIYTMTKTRLLYFGTDPYQTHPILTYPIFSNRLRFVVNGSDFKKTTAKNGARNVAHTWVRQKLPN